ncbi:MAG: hypothetical protein AMS18_08075 [Gemmatimonas sp. SG8_17]|nr:MAG: hypothetical protein AMS18_08075 [Gemmatimonas sp. SG8_17]
MSKQDLQRGIDEIRRALTELDADLPVDEHPSEGVRDVGLAVDNLRRSTWAVLTTRHSGDYDAYLARIRIHRATQACEDLLSDLYAEAVVPIMPGLRTFHAVLENLVAVCKESPNE